MHDEMEHLLREVHRSLKEKALLLNLQKFNQLQTMRLIGDEIMGRLFLLHPPNSAPEQKLSNNSDEPRSARMDDFTVCHVPVEHTQIVCNV